MKTQKQSILFTTHQIEREIKRISEDIKRNESLYSSDNPVYICVLNGAFMFFSDLVKNLDDGYIDFIKARSYVGVNQHELKILSDIDIDIEDKRVYLIDDIYDSGKTMNSLIKHLETKNPKSITPITLFVRGNQKLPNNGFSGFVLENESFLVGFGLNDEKNLKRTQLYIEGIVNDNN